MMPQHAVRQKQFWYLSYAYENSFQGGVVIESESFLEACARSKQQGLSPGGQVIGTPIPPEVSNDPKFAAYVNRCMSESETIAFLKAFDADPRRPDGTAL